MDSDWVDVFPGIEMGIYQQSLCDRLPECQKYDLKNDTRPPRKNRSSEFHQMSQLCFSLNSFFFDPSLCPVDLAVAVAHSFGAKERVVVNGTQQKITWRGRTLYLYKRKTTKRNRCHYNLLLNGVYWGYNPLTQTCSPKQGSYDTNPKQGTICTVFDPPKWVVQWSLSKRAAFVCFLGGNEETKRHPTRWDRRFWGVRRWSESWPRGDTLRGGGLLAIRSQGSIKKIGGEELRKSIGGGPCLPSPLSDRITPIFSAIQREPFGRGV